MNREQIVTTAAIIYYVLLLPKESQQRVMDLLITGSLRGNALFEQYGQISNEVLTANCATFISGNIDMLEGVDDQEFVSDAALLSIVDLLFDDRNGELSRIERARLLATLQTLCTIGVDHLGCKLLAQTLQDAYDGYRLVAGLPAVKFLLAGKPAFGSYIQLEGFDEVSMPDLDPVAEQEELTNAEANPLQSTEVLQKLPKFWNDIQGRDKRLLREFYQLIVQDKECRLFSASNCDENNFLALFEGVPGYEEVEPKPFRASSQLGYWGVFLSAIYDDIPNIYLASGQEINRGSVTTDEMSVSSIAAQLIWPKHGKRSSSPSSYDRGSGTLSMRQKLEFEKLIEDCYREARLKALPISEVRHQLPVRAAGHKGKG